MRFVGLDNYVTVLTDPDLSGSSSTPSSSSSSSASSRSPSGCSSRRSSGGWRPARSGAVARTVLFLPQVIPLVAAGIVWSWLLSKTGLVNQVLDAIGLGGLTRTWLADFGLALPAVGVIGAWVLLGLCTVLLLTGMSKIDAVAVRIGAHRRRERLAGVPLHHRPQPALRDRRVHHGDGHRVARRVRHRVHLDARRPRHRDDGARPRDLPASRSTGDRSASPPRSPSCSSCSCSSSCCPSSA